MHRRSTTRARRLLAAATALLPSCTSVVASAPAARLEPVGAVQGTYVPSGTTFVATVDSTVDAPLGGVLPGFAATMATALYSRDGALLVPAGTRLRGTLVAAGLPRAPQLRLELDRVETTRGPARAVAEVEQPRPSVARGPRRFVPTAGPDPYASPYDAFSLGGQTPIGGGPGAGWYALGGGPWYRTWRPAAVRIAQGTALRFVLTGALVPPAAATPAP